MCKFYLSESLGLNMRSVTLNRLQLAQIGNVVPEKIKNLHLCRDSYLITNMRKFEFLQKKKTEHYWQNPRKVTADQEFLILERKQQCNCQP